MRALRGAGHRDRRRLLRDRPRRAARPRADEAFLIGPGPASESYLVVEKILEVAKESGAEAIHPGYGFLAENAAFAQRRARRPASSSSGRPAEAIEAMGSKTRARELMQAAGVPIVPGTTEPVDDRRGRAQGASTTRSATRSPSRRRAAAAARASASRSSAGRARGGLRGREPRGREVLLRRHRLPRALPARPAPRRGAGAGRHARQRDPPGRARLLGAAPPPEADRGVAGARRRRGDARADRQDRNRRRGRRGLRRRRHDRGPAARTASTTSSR